MTASLKELAQERLDHFQKMGLLSRAPTLERTWLLAGLRSTIEGRRVDPDIDVLKPLTVRLWEGLDPGWPPEHVWSVMGAIVASHRFAIVKSDADWLAHLYASWESCPVEIHPAVQLRALGEIGLGLAPGGPRPFGWSEEELSDLPGEGPGEASDRAWRALAASDFEAARRALLEYESVLAPLAERWEAAPIEGLRTILAYPEARLRVEPRALAALLERAQPAPPAMG